ncbi:MAG TPA: CNNM domain-containing protein [Burkholderiales bacterium]|nr:CNNM domain-containing protein [Burkholderiales bacterium]
MEKIPFLALLAALGLLLLVSAFFSIAETGMMAVNRYRLRALERTGHRGARIASDLLRETDKLLSVLLAGNTLVNAGITMIVGVMTIDLFGHDKVFLGAATIVVAFLILVFAEITPKVIGARYPEQTALAASYVLKPLVKGFAWMLWIANLFVRCLLWILRVPTGQSAPQRLSIEELRALVLESGQFMPKKHQSILVNLFDLEAITVEDVMTPRAQIEAVDLDAPAENLLAQMTTAYHTRLVAYRGELGNLAGILHLRKVMHLLRSEELDREALAALLMEPYYVPAGTPVFAQLQYFQENRQRIALVVDEYGELQGLVTLEDIIEEIIGEFTTTAPVKSETYAWDKDGSALVEGSSVLRELNRKLGLTLPLDGPKTLNGLILEHLRDIPDAGVALRIGEVRMEIVQTQDRVIRTVRLFRPPASGLARAA